MIKKVRLHEFKWKKEKYDMIVEYEEVKTKLGLEPDILDILFESPIKWSDITDRFIDAVLEAAIQQFELRDEIRREY